MYSIEWLYLHYILSNSPGHSICTWDIRPSWHSNWCSHKSRFVFYVCFWQKKSALLFCYSLYDEFRALTYLAWDWVILELMTWFLLCWSFVQETVVGQPLMNKGSALVWHFRYFYSVTLLIPRYVMCGYNWFII